MKKTVCLLLLLSMLTILPASDVKAAGTPIAVGIDVSRWQGPINWSAVAASGVSFAFIKVGSLNSGLDPYFVQNMIGAQMAGIKTGVYIYSYAKSVEQVAAEAQFVLAAISNFRISMPVVFDIEDKTQKNMTAAELSMMANTFCALIEAEGYYPMVYANKNWFSTKLMGVLYDKWVAQWNATCDIPDAAFWQFTETGKIGGVAGNVDIDYQFKDLSQSIVDTGWVARRGAMYYYNGYKMQRGWTPIANSMYFFGADGKLYIGWLPFEDNMYFLQANGAMAVGFTPIGQAMYYFNLEGKMQTGLQNINGLQYLFGPDGVMYVGMYFDGSHYMYFANDGHMLKGLSDIGTQKFFFDENGYMYTGYLDIAGATYLFGADGAMVTGWFDNGIIKQYFGADGVMAKGLTILNGSTYYFDQNGNMQIGWVTLGTGTYLFDLEGKMVTNGWFQDGTSAYYLNADGTRVENTAMIIDGNTFIFDQNGVAFPVVAPLPTDVIPQ